MKVRYLTRYDAFRLPTSNAIGSPSIASIRSKEVLQFQDENGNWTDVPHEFDEESLELARIHQRELQIRKSR